MNEKFRNVVSGIARFVGLDYNNGHEEFAFYGELSFMNQAWDGFNKT